MVANSDFESGYLPSSTSTSLQKIRAAIYARISSYNQKGNYSTKEQVACCLKYIEQRGWIACYLFFDEAESGGTIDRPRFQAMLDMARLRYFDVIVAWKLDRFCRSLVDLVNVERALRNCGVSLCSVTEFLDTTSTIGRFNFRTLGSVAELERELIGERSKMGLHALARLHKWPNSRPPLGFKRLEDGSIKKRDKEASLVRRIFRLYLQEKSMPQVAFRLNHEKILTRNGRIWTAATVREVLTNEIYMGIYEVAGVREFVDHLRILDDGIFLDAKKTRMRYEQKGAKKMSIPLDRKMAKIEIIFDKYQELLEGRKT